MSITPPPTNKFFDPQWHYQCKCGAIIAKNSVCPLCQTKEKTDLTLLNKVDKNARKEINERMKLNRELLPPKLEPYKISWLERKEVRRKLKGQLLELNQVAPKKIK